MGAVKDELKGSGSSKKAKTTLPGAQNILERLRIEADNISALIEKKDEDTLNEGSVSKAENIRKASSLRAMHSLLLGAISIAEDY